MIQTEANDRLDKLIVRGMMSRLITGLILVAIIAAIAMTYSAYRAKNVADNYIKVLEDVFEFSSLKFIPMMSFPESQPFERYHAVWVVSYCPKDDFCCFPVQVIVSLTGKIQLTNPRDLKERMDRIRNNLSQLQKTSSAKSISLIMPNKSENQVLFLAISMLTSSF